MSAVQLGRNRAQYTYSVHEMNLEFSQKNHLKVLAPMFQ
jgi:hypothetical protein